jgi:hypothetical protein
VDLNTVRILLARESGLLPTSVACHRLNVTREELLRMRRQAIEAVLGVLPSSAKKTPLPMVEVGGSK